MREKLQFYYKISTRDGILNIKEAWWLEESANKRQDHAGLLDFYDQKKEQLERGIAMGFLFG
jgi:hypothetical protein